MIRRVTQKKLGKNKTGWIFDRRAEVWATFEVDLRIAGERIRRRGFRTKKEADEFADQLKATGRLSVFGLKPAIKFPLVAELFEMRLRGLEASDSREHKTAKRVFSAFQKILGPGARLSDVSRKHFREFADGRIAEGVKPATANREITVIAATLRRAPEYFQGLDGFVLPPIFRPKFSKKGRSRVITADEREIVIGKLTADRKEDETDRHYRARLRVGLILKFALLYGLRHGEISLIRKKWLDRRRRVLKIERPKVDQTGEIPVSDLALEILDRADRELYPAGDYFFSEKGKTHNKNYIVLRDVCEELEIPYGRKTVDGFVFHDARHTFITTLAANGFDNTTISSFSGHSSATMVANYTHATASSREKASEYMSRVVGGATGDLRELREIFDRTQKGEIEFDDFVREITKHFSSVF